jgi:hypothetical protein
MKIGGDVSSTREWRRVRERESSLVRGKGVGETGGGAHTFIGAGGRRGGSGRVVTAGIKAIMPMMVGGR